MRIDWGALEAAFSSAAGAGEPRAWLDRETGAVVGGGAPGGRDLGPREERDPRRYLPIPGIDASEFYGWMSSFAATVADPEVRAALNRALRGPMASAGRFQSALEGDAASRSRWPLFHEERLRAAIDAWLEREGLRPDAPSPWGSAPVAATTAAAPPPAPTPDRTAARQPLLDEERRRAIVGRLEKVPLARLLGMRLVRLEPGECDLSIDDRRDLDGIFASLHGGILATLADSAFAFAALTLLDPEEVVTTVELSIRFLAPCREAVVARSRVVKSGRTLISGHVELEGLTTGTLFAVSGMTYMRLGKRAAT